MTGEGPGGLWGPTALLPSLSVTGGSAPAKNNDNDTASALDGAASGVTTVVAIPSPVGESMGATSAIAAAVAGTGRFDELARAENRAYPVADPAPVTDTDLLELAAASGAGSGLDAGSGGGGAGGEIDIGRMLGSLKTDSMGALLWGAEAEGLAAPSPAVTAAADSDGRSKSRNGAEVVDGIARARESRAASVAVAVAHATATAAAPTAAGLRSESEHGGNSTATIENFPSSSYNATADFNSGNDSAAVADVDFDLMPCHIDPETGASMPWPPLPTSAPAASLPWASSVLAAERERALEVDTHPILLGIQRAQSGEFPLNVFLPTAFTLRCAIRGCRDNTAAPLWREALVLLDLMFRLGMPLDPHAVTLTVQTCAHADREAEVVALVKMLLQSQVPLRVSFAADLAVFFARRGSNSTLLWDVLLWTLQSPAPRDSDGPRRLDSAFLNNLVKTFVLEGYPMRAAAFLLAVLRVSPKTLSLYSALTHAAAQALPRLDDVAAIILRTQEQRYSREFTTAAGSAVSRGGDGGVVLSNVLLPLGPGIATRSAYPARGHFAPLSVEALIPSWRLVMMGLALYHQPSGLRLVVQLWARRQLVPLTHTLGYLDHLALLIAVARYGSSRRMLLAMASARPNGRSLRIVPRPMRTARVDEVPGRAPSPGVDVIHNGTMPKMYMHLLAAETLARFLVNVDVPMHNNPYEDTLRFIARDAELAFADVLPHSGSMTAHSDNNDNADCTDDVSVHLDANSLIDSASATQSQSRVSMTTLIAKAHRMSSESLPPMTPETMRATADADVLRAELAVSDSVSNAANTTSENNSSSVVTTTAAVDYDIPHVEALWPYIRFVASSSRFPPSKQQLITLADQLWDLMVARFQVKSSLTVFSLNQLVLAAGPSTAAAAQLVTDASDSNSGSLVTGMAPLRVRDGTLPLFSAVRFARMNHSDYRERYPVAAARADAVVRALPTCALTPSLWSTHYSQHTPDEDPMLARTLSVAGKHTLFDKNPNGHGSIAANPAAAVASVGYVTPELDAAPATGLVIPRTAVDVLSRALREPAGADALLQCSDAALADAGFTGRGVNTGTETHMIVVDLRNHSFATGTLALRRALRELIDWGCVRARAAQEAATPHSAARGSAKRESAATAKSSTAGGKTPPGPTASPQLPGSLMILAYSHYSRAPHTVTTRLMTAFDLPAVLMRLGFPRAYLSSPISVDAALAPEGAEGGPAAAVVIPAAALNQWLYCAIQPHQTALPALAQDLKNHFA